MTIKVLNKLSDIIYNTKEDEPTLNKLEILKNNFQNLTNIEKKDINLFKPTELKDYINPNKIPDNCFDKDLHILNMIVLFINFVNDDIDIYINIAAAFRS